MQDGKEGVIKPPVLRIWSVEDSRSKFISNEAEEKDKKNRSARDAQERGGGHKASSARSARAGGARSEDSPPSTSEMKKTTAMKSILYGEPKKKKQPWGYRGGGKNVLPIERGKERGGFGSTSPPRGRQEKGNKSSTSSRSPPPPLAGRRGRAAAADDGSPTPLAGYGRGVGSKSPPPLVGHSGANVDSTIWLPPSPVADRGREGSRVRPCCEAGEGRHPPPRSVSSTSSGRSPGENRRVGRIIWR